MAQDADTPNAPAIRSGSYDMIGKECVMRIGARVTASLGLLFALGSAFAPVAPAAHAQYLARARVVTLSLDSTARVLDMSPLGSTLPLNWFAPTFDDSSWDHARAVSPGALACMRLRVGTPWTARAAYWGPNPADTYIFRQPFTLPRAHDYYGSELDLNARATLVVSVNGHSLSTGNDGSGSGQRPPVAHTERYSISPYLQQGANVIVTYAVSASPAPSAPCTGIAYMVTLRATGVR